MVKNILVPVDGSESSVKALSLAVDIAEKHAADLSALFVASSATEKELQHFTSHEYNQKGESAVTIVTEKMGKSTISQMINKLKTNIVVRPVVLFGNPADKIIEYSTANKVDMVVMGNRGLGAIKGMVMGSVSRKVSNQVKCTFVSIK